MRKRKMVVYNLPLQHQDCCPCKVWAQVANAPAQTDHIQIIHIGDDPADPESYDVTVPLHFDNQLRVNMTIDIG